MYLFMVMQLEWWALWSYKHHTTRYQTSRTFKFICFLWLPKRCSAQIIFCRGSFSLSKLQESQTRTHIQLFDVTRIEVSERLNKEKVLAFIMQLMEVFLTWVPLQYIWCQSVYVRRTIDRSLWFSALCSQHIALCWISVCPLF